MPKCKYCFEAVCAAVGAFLAILIELGVKSENSAFDVVHLGLTRLIDAEVPFLAVAIILVIIAVLLTVVSIRENEVEVSDETPRKSKLLQSFWTGASILAVIGTVIPVSRDIDRAAGPMQEDFMHRYAQSSPMVMQAAMVYDPEPEGLASPRSLLRVEYCRDKETKLSVELKANKKISTVYVELAEFYKKENRTFAKKVYIGGQAGAISFDVPEGTYVVRIEAPGFKIEQREAQVTCQGKVVIPLNLKSTWEPKVFQKLYTPRIIPNAK